MTQPGSTSGSHQHKLGFFAVPILCGIAWVSRCLYWPHVFLNGRLMPDMPDTYYHLRIIQLLLEGKLSSPLMDTYILYPDTGMVFWPLGFDHLIASLYPVLAAGENMDIFFNRTAFVIPLLGTLVILLFHWFLSRQQIHAGVSAALTLHLSLSMALIGNAAVGRIDHQVMEPLIWVMLLGALLTLTRKRSRTVSLLTGILLGSSLWIWNGALLLAFLFHGALLVSCWTSPDHRQWLLENWQDVGIAALFSATAAVLLQGAVWSHPFSAVYLSCFHVGCYGLAAGLPVLLRLSMKSEHQPGDRRLLAVGWGCIILALSLLIVQSGTLWEILWRYDPVAATAPESAGLFSAYGLTRLLFQPLILMTPLAIWGLAIRTRQKNRTGMDAGMLLLTLLTAMIAVMQIRFLPLFELTASLALALSFSHWIMDKPDRARFIMIGLLLLSLLPLSFVLMQSHAVRSGPAPMTPMHQIASNLREYSPPTRNYLEPMKPIENGYAVFCPDWQYGHFLVFVAQRPVIVTPFGAAEPFSSRLSAVLEAIEIPTEAAFLSFCHQYGIRYVIAKTSPTTASTQKGYYHTLIGPTAERAGAATRMVPSSMHFRLVDLVENRPGAGASIRVYEVVAAARFQIGLPESDGDYEAAIEMKTANGTLLQYRIPLEPDASGFTTFSCPYSTDGNGMLATTSPLEIRDKTRNLVISRVRVREDDVRRGLVRSLAIDMNSGKVTASGD